MFVTVWDEVAGCAFGDVEGKDVVAAVEIKGGTRFHSGLGFPTWGCCYYRKAHWAEVPG